MNKDNIQNNEKDEEDKFISSEELAPLIDEALIVLKDDLKRLEEYDKGINN